jgi:competence protein ComGC
MKHSVIRTDRMTRNRCNREAAFTRIELVVVVVIVAVLIAMLWPAFKAARRKPSHASCAGALKQIGLAFLQWSLDNQDKFPMQVSVTNGGTEELVATGAPYPHLRALSNELNQPWGLLCYGDSKARAEARKLMDAYFATRGPHARHTGQIFDPFPNFPVSYFVGVDATRQNGAMWLSGDGCLLVNRKPVKRGLLSLGTNTPVEWAKPNRHYTGEAEYILTVDGSVHSVADDSLCELLQKTGVATNRLAMP